MSLTIGTRASVLARTQTQLTYSLLLEQFPTLNMQIKHIKSEGDVSAAPLSQIGGRGVFTAHLSQALLEGRIDIAVHSLKDLPTADAEGLTLGAILSREDPRDVLIARAPLNELPAGTHIGSGSLRRRVQLNHIRRDLKFSEIRGNVHTRIQKVLDGQYDATLLAQAGLNRLETMSDEPPSQTLGNDLFVYPIDVNDMVPAVSQAAIAIECRSDDTDTLNKLKTLDHAPTRQAVEIERRLLKRLGGGCQIPFAAHVDINNQVHLMIADDDSFHCHLQGHANDAEALMDELLQKGQHVVDRYLG